MPDDDAILHALDYADRWLAYRRWRLRIPGVQVAVRIGGELLLESAHGVADASTDAALTPKHRFRIASHSKALAALAVMRLVDDGRLRLDDTVETHVPSLRGTEAGALQLRELLSHGSGVSRDGDDVSFWHLQARFPDADALRSLARAGIARVPTGTEFKYSNLGFGLVGLVVEAVAGRSYAAALDELVLAPLGAHEVTADHAHDGGAQHVTGHGALHSSDAREPLGSPSAAALAPATGATATAAALSDVLRAVTDADARLLSAAARRRMRQPQWTFTGRDGASASYGLGLMHRQIGGRTWVGHGGAWTGQATRTIVDSERDVVVSVLTNAIDAPAEELAVGIARILSTALESAPAAPTEAERARQRTFEGTFASIWGRTDVIELGGRLLAISPTAADPLQAVDVLDPLDADRVVVTAATGMGSNHEIASAERDASGAIVRWRGAIHADAVPAVPTDA